MISLTNILRSIIKENGLDHLEYKPGSGKHKPQGEGWVSTEDSLPPYGALVKVFNAFSGKYGADKRDHKNPKNLWSNNWFSSGWTHWKASDE